MFRLLFVCALLGGSAAAATGVEPLWRGAVDDRARIELLQVEGGAAWLLVEGHDGGGALIEVDLARGTSIPTPVDLAGARRALWNRPDATDADRAVLAGLLDHGWSRRYGAPAGVAEVPGGFITTGGAPPGTLGDWLWRYDRSGAPVERFTSADAGYHPMLSPGGGWLMFEGCAARPSAAGCETRPWFVHMADAAVYKADGPFEAWMGATWASDEVALVAHADAQGRTCVARFTPQELRRRDLACVDGLATVSWSPSAEVTLFDQRGLLTRVRSADGAALGAPAHGVADNNCRLISDEVALCDRALVDLVRDVSFPLDGLATPERFGEIALMRRAKTGRAELVRLDPEAIRSAPPPAAPPLADLRGEVTVHGRSYPLDVRLDRPAPPVRAGRGIAWAGELFFQTGYVPAILSLDLDTGATRLSVWGPQWDPVWLPDGRLAGLGRNSAGQVCVMIDRAPTVPELRHCVDADDASLTAIDAGHALFTWEPPLRAPPEHVRVTW